MRVLEVHDQGLVGSLFTAGDGRSYPGVLVLGGSEGGVPNDLAGLLAAEGFTCLALGYFKVPGRPRRLVEIPLEYVETALVWLRERRAVGNSPVGIVGSSKGAELGLLAAASFPDGVSAVVADSPSSVVFAGIDRERQAGQRSSWSYRGRPVAFVPFPAAVRPSVGLRGVSFEPIYRAALENAEAVAAAAIPIEQTRAPILLISGDKDRVWPASPMAAALKARLAQVGQGDQVVHLRYPNAGHGLTPWLPTIGKRLTSWLYDVGGDGGDHRAAVRDAWGKAVAFLRHNLS